MVGFLVLYHKPEDIEAFERHYRDVHIPLSLAAILLVRASVHTPAAARPAGPATRGGRWKSQLKRTSVPPSFVSVSVTRSWLSMPKGRCTRRPGRRAEELRPIKLASTVTPRHRHIHEAADHMAASRSARDGR